MKIEIYVAKATEVGKSKNGYVPSPATVMNNLETKGFVPTPAPNTAATTPSQIVKK